MEKIVEIKKLNNYYGKKHFLKDASFSIFEGDFHAFIGENGSGKTTTMCYISGVLNDFNGEIHLKGKNIKQIDNKSLLFIPERVSFPSHLSAFGFVKTFASIFLGEEIDDSKIDELFQEFDISDIKTNKANKLSSGQKKKISLIRAILSKPKVLLIDEPAANLDPTSRYKLFNSLKKLNKEGTTIFISSHIIAELEKYVNSATFIKKGEIIWNGNLKKGMLSEKYNELIIKDGKQWIVKNY